MEIKHLGPNDSESIIENFKKTFEVFRHLPNEEVRSRWQLEGVQLTRSFALFEKDKVLAFALLSPRPENIHITSFGVLPDGQRKGRGSFLLMFLLQESGMLPLSLAVEEDNRRARLFYARHGFREDEEIFVLEGRPEIAMKETRGLYRVSPHPQNKLIEIHTFKSDEGEASLEYAPGFGKITSVRLHHPSALSSLLQCMKLNGEMVQVQVSGKKSVDLFRDWGLRIRACQIGMVRTPEKKSP
jgi:GNAT superfamily N-acetyltransferase